MSYPALLRPFFKPPSHRRAELLRGFGYGAVWALLFALDQRLFSLPYGLLPAMFFMNGIAEALPRSWITVAAILRIGALVIAVISIIWFALRLTGWLPR